MTKLELIDKRKQLRVANKALLAAAKAEARQLTNEEQTQFGNNLEELDKVTDQLDELDIRGGGQRDIQPIVAVEERLSVGHILSTLANNGTLTEPQQALVNEGRSRFTNAGVNTTGQVQIPIHYRSIVDAAAADGTQHQFILDLATPIREASILAKLGANFIYETGIIGLPSYKGNSFAWYAENEEIADSADGFENCVLVNKRLAGCIPVSKNVLLSSNLDVLGIIDADIRAALSEAIDSAVFTFPVADAKQPGGIQQNAAMFSDALSHPNLLKIETKLLENKFTNIKYVVSPATRAKLMTTVKGGAKSDLGFLIDNTGMSINGFPCVFTASANDAETANIFAGDFTKLYVKISAIDILFDPYTLAKKNAVNLVVNVLADIQYRDKDAFQWGSCPK